MQPSSSSSSLSSPSIVCCSRRWCRSPDDDKADTWMEPCRSSSTKSRRRQQTTTDNVEEEIDDCNNNNYNNNVVVDAARPLLLDETEDDDGELFHSGSSFEAAIKAADASSNLDATTPPLLKNGNSNNSNSNRWRYPFSSSGRRRPIMDAMDILGEETVNALRGGSTTNNKFAKSNNQQQQGSLPLTTVVTPKPITSIAILENGLFVTASKSDRYIQLWRVVVNNVVVSSPSPKEKENDDDSEEQQHDDINNNNNNNNINHDERDEIEFICHFKGHVSGITTMVKFDKRGRFLTASVDKTVKLWEIDCCNNNNDDCDDGPPINLLATFTNLDKRWIKCIVPLDEGSFVRKTDSINISMIKAMAKKTVFEGPTSLLQQASFDERSIIQCSGAFATSSKNGKTIKVWEMSVVDGNKTNNDDDSTTNNNDVAKVCLVQELQHDAVIEAVDAAEDGCSIIAGDVMGDIFLWSSSKSKSYLSALGVTKSSKQRWTLIHKFTWRGDVRVHTGEIFQHSITSVCFLDGSKKFVSGTKEGMIQIWDGNNSDNKPQTIQVAEQPVSRIQKLSINEPNVEGFSVCCDGGRVVALTVKFEGEDVIELDAFPVKNCTKEDGESRVITSMKAIVMPCNNGSRTVSLIVGDDNGTVSLSHTELV